MHESNHHILSSRLVSIPRSWAAAACQHLLISKPTQCHFYGSTHWRTWHRERHCCFINSFMLAQLYPVQDFHSIITMHSSLFPPSFPTCHSRRADAYLPPSCSSSSMSPCSRPHSSSLPVSFPALHDSVPAEPDQLPSMVLSPQRPSQSLTLWEQALCKRRDTSHSTWGIWSRAGRRAQLF